MKRRSSGTTQNFQGPKKKLFPWTFYILSIEFKLRYQQWEGITSYDKSSYSCHFYHISMASSSPKKAAFSEGYKITFNLKVVVLK